jgi:hypothetical protein
MWLMEKTTCLGQESVVGAEGFGWGESSSVAKERGTLCKLPGGPPKVSWYLPGFDVGHAGVGVGITDDNTFGPLALVLAGGIVG